MKFRSIAAAAACCSALVLAQVAPGLADGMPEPDDANFNPVPSVPGVPAPGMTQPAPIKPAKSTKRKKQASHEKPAKHRRHNTRPSEAVAPAPATTPAPAAAPSPVSNPAPAPVISAPAPVVQVPPAPSAAPAPAAPVSPAPVLATPPVNAPAVPAPVAPPVVPPAPVTPPAVTPPAVTAPAPATPVAPRPASQQQRTVYEVLSVEVQFPDKNPSAATIVVKGTSRTGGWTNLELRPLQTFAPEVGMRSFTLVGTPPSGMSTQALTAVTATHRIDPLPADIKTIRVLSESNEVAQRFR